ncbi:MAG: TonB-dependent receptor [Muribaculaceae bacterium]|nr:TonB-dependent receptor [Muribaculaceae bacterium]
MSRIDFPTFASKRFLIMSLLPLVMPMAAKSVTSTISTDNSDDFRIDTIPELIVTGLQPIVTSQTLKGTELRALSTTSVADALKYFAGAQIKDYGGLGGMKTVNVRSMGAHHVGIYIDGIRLTNAQNGTVDLGKYSLSTMESVELFNGNKLDRCQSPSEFSSASTVYFRTRRPTTDSLSLMLRAASFSTFSGKLNLQTSRKGWQAMIDAEALHTKGNYPFRYKSEYEDTIGRRSNNDIRYYRLEGALFNKGFSSHVYYYYSERGCPGGIVRRLSDKYTNIGREWDSDFFIQASYRNSYGPHSILANLKYSNEYLRYNTDYPDNQNTVKADNHYHTNDIYAAAAYTWSPFTWLDINAGYDFRWTRMKADLKRFTPVTRHDQKAVIALNAEKWGFRLAASILFQHYKDFTATKAGAADPLHKFTPSVTLGYSTGNFNVHAWYKRIFRVPTLNDLYYTQSGNRNLKPEYTTQWDLGGEYMLLTGAFSFTAKADIYLNRVTDRIVCLPLRGTYTWSMMNYGYTFCRGLNATLNGRYAYKDFNFSLLTSFTIQRDLDRTDPESELYNKPICYSPTFSCGLTGIIAWRRLSLTLSDIFVGKRMWSYADPDDILKPYNNVDLKLDYTHSIGKKFNIGATFEILDIFDVQYEHIPRYPMPGRNWRMTLTFSI